MSRQSEIQPEIQVVALNRRGKSARKTRKTGTETTTNQKKRERTSARKSREEIPRRNHDRKTAKGTTDYGQ